MTPPRLYACHFGHGLQDQWPRLARVLEMTAARHCPGWRVEIEQRKPGVSPRLPNASSGDVANTWKLDRWCEVVEAAAQSEQLLLIDVDTAILQPLEAIWELPFDVAYTVRPAVSRFPLNAGVLFLRVNDQSRAFLRAWRDENRKMLGDALRHGRWRRKYAGMNQASLGCLLEGKVVPGGAELLRVPCQEWNCEDSTWEAFSECTRILHIKSQLRLAIFNGVPGHRELRPLVALWRRLEHEAAEDGRGGRPA